MKRFYLFFIFFFFNSAFAYTPPTHCKILDSLHLHFCRTYCAQKKLVVAGDGGKLMDDVLQIYLPLATMQRVSLQEARALFVDVTQTYLSLVNNNVNIRPYLHNYPFKIDNLNFKIGFLGNQTNDEIALVCNKDDHIVYSTWNFEKERLVLVYDEPYEVALHILEKEGAAVVLEGLDPGQ